METLYSYFSMLGRSRDQAPASPEQGRNEEDGNEQQAREGCSGREGGLPDTRQEGLKQQDESHPFRRTAGKCTSAQSRATFPESTFLRAPFRPISPLAYRHHKYVFYARSILLLPCL